MVSGRDEAKDKKTLSGLFSRYTEDKVVDMHAEDKESYTRLYTDLGRTSHTLMTGGRGAKLYISDIDTFYSVLASCGWGAHNAINESMAPGASSLPLVFDLDIKLTKESIWPMEYTDVMEKVIRPALTTVSQLWGGGRGILMSRSGCISQDKRGPAYFKTGIHLFFPDINVDAVSRSVAFQTAKHDHASTTDTLRTPSVDPSDPEGKRVLVSGIHFKTGSNIQESYDDGISQLKLCCSAKRYRCKSSWPGHEECGNGAVHWTDRYRVIGIVQTGDDGLWGFDDESPEARELITATSDCRKSNSITRSRRKLLFMLSQALSLIHI